MNRIVPLIVLVSVGQLCRAEEPKKLVDVKYGSHARQVLDFYQAKSDKATPVVFYIHGGGWQGGDKKTNPSAFLNNGISVVAINYCEFHPAVEPNVDSEGDPTWERLCKVIVEQLGVPRDSLRRETDFVKDLGF